MRAVVLLLALLVFAPAAGALAGHYAAAGQSVYRYSRGVAYDCPLPIALEVRTSTIEPFLWDLDLYVAPGVRTTTLAQCALPELAFAWRGISGGPTTGWHVATDDGCVHHALDTEPIGVMKRFHMVRANRCSTPFLTESWSAFIVWSV